MPAVNNTLNIMTALKTKNNILKTALFTTLALASTLAQAANVAGDWQSNPALQSGGSGIWDNSTNNSLGSSNTWQLWNGSEWVTENGNTAGTQFPSNNTGVITILAGTTISNSINGGSSNNVDGIVVPSGATYLFASGTNTLLHPSSPNPEFTYDMDVSGNFGLLITHGANFNLASGATIVMENGSTMTNFGLASGDQFGGPGYTNSGLGTWVANAITFKSGSTFVQTTSTADAKGCIPHATWEAGSTCLIAPGVSTGIIFSGMAGQTFYDFTWYWPLETVNHKFGGSAEAGSFTVAHNFSMTAGTPTTTNSYIPSLGNTLTVGGNIGLTNVTWAPLTTAGSFTLNVGGNFSVDSTALITINNNSAWGNVNFDGGTAPSNPQIVTFGASPFTSVPGGALGSQAGWNWTVNSGSSISVNSVWEVNTGPGGAPGNAGFITNNGTITLTANGTLEGTGNTIILGSGSTLDVTLGAWDFGAGDTLQGSGTIIGNLTPGTSIIQPGSANAGGTLTFTNGILNYGGSTSTNIFNLTSNPSGANSQIVIYGSGGGGSLLHPNGAQIVINALSGTLSTTTDYVLFNLIGGGTIASSTFAALAWTGTIPSNYAEYSIVITGTQVLLHYGPTVVAPQPDLTSLSFSGNDLTFNGTNAISGTYTVLMSTNVSAPLTSWANVGTFTVGTPGANGSFAGTVLNALNPSDPVQFFVLKAP